MSWITQHHETLLGAALGALVSIPTSFYLSYYSGLIVARRSRFEDLRYEVIRLLQLIEWPPDTRTFVLPNGRQLHEMMLVSGDLIAHGHDSAAETVLELNGSIAAEFSRTKDFLNGDEKNARFTSWMRSVRTMEPNRWPIFNPWPRLYKKVIYDDAP